MAKINPEFPHDMFKFIHRPIRIIDQTDGKNFVERFLVGPQTIWEDTQLKIAELGTINDPASTRADLLQFLKDHVGFTRDLNNITNGLGENDLRKLISLAVALWKQKGVEPGYENIVRFFTGKSVRIFNWFDFRLIIGENAFGEEQLGEDSWFISVPGVEDQLDEFFSDIRIVDEGDLNKILMLRILNLMRPVSERLNVIFISFFDDFIEGAGRFNVEAGSAAINTEQEFQLEVSTIVSTDVLNDTEFKDYVLQVKATDDDSAGGVLSVLFFFQDIDNFYEFRINTTLAVVSLHKTVGGVSSQIGSTTAFDLVPEASYIYTVTTSFNSLTSNTLIKTFVDANAIHKVVDSSFEKGKFGMKTDASTVMKVDEIEMFELPLDVQQVLPGFAL